jgi:hypothetical protein
MTDTQGICWGVPQASRAREEHSNTATRSYLATPELLRALNDRLRVRVSVDPLLDDYVLVNDRPNIVISFFAGEAAFNVIIDTRPEGESEKEVLIWARRQALDASTFARRLVREAASADNKSRNSESLSLESVPTEHEPGDTPEIYLGRIASAQAMIKQLTEEIDTNVHLAKAGGVTWEDIGQAAGVTRQSAYQRWSERGRERHREAHRSYMGRTTTEG